jgi:hypothetical protein
MWPDRLSPWRSAGFAFCLSAIILCDWLYEVGSRQSPPFTVLVLACFLPMCFYFNADEVARLRKDVAELQGRLGEHDRPSAAAGP